MSFATIDDLRSQLGASPRKDPEYLSKMMHRIPEAKSINREAFILERCRGKRVLEFGASGPLHEALRGIASKLAGVDRVSAPGVLGFDLDDVKFAALPKMEADVILCGEVIEHLSNPGWFLSRLAKQYKGVEVLITVPNAFTDVCRKHLKNGFENVNHDHVCWYSPKTLEVLLSREGFRIEEFYWYGGDGPTAQGIAVVVRA